jgi:large subunit ribosomal protein L17
MFRNMVTSLFKHERIRTTDVKAKELRRWADQLVTLAKRGDLHARRLALSIIRERDVVQKLFDEAQDRYGAVSGGYTRIVKVGRRPGDAAPVSIIELITPEDVKKKSKKKPKKTTKAAKPAAPKAAPAEKPEKEEPAPEEAAEAAATEAPEADAPAEETAEAADAPAEVEAAAEEAPAEETPDEAAPEEDEKKEE